MPSLKFRRLNNSISDLARETHLTLVLGAFGFPLGTKYASSCASQTSESIAITTGKVDWLDE